MNEIESLHTAARRYCVKYIIHWTTEGRNSSQREGENIYPRYNVLRAILAEIERLRPEKLGSVEALRLALIGSGMAAQNPFTRPPQGDISAAAIADERQKFANYLSRLSGAELRQVEPLPYRRTLSDAECQALTSRLEGEWGTGAGKTCWYPLNKTRRRDVVAFQAPDFQRAISEEQLRAFLAERGISRLYEIREYGPSYEIALELFEADYDLAEGFWCDGSMDWIVYASHESSTTIGGQWLIERVRRAWPAWDAHVWTGF